MRHPHIVTGNLGLLNSIETGILGFGGIMEYGHDQNKAFLAGNVYLGHVTSDPVQGVIPDGMLDGVKLGEGGLNALCEGASFLNFN